MEILREGHRFELENFENKEASGQIIQFIEKAPQDGTDVLKTVFDGTTNEEVLGVLINRMEYLQGKFPCIENAKAILSLEKALFWLNERTRDREKRDVEGKLLK